MPILQNASPRQFPPEYVLVFTLQLSTKLVIEEDATPVCCVTHELIPALRVLPEEYADEHG
jgi:hypothetical protein